MEFLEKNRGIKRVAMNDIEKILIVSPVPVTYPSRDGYSMVVVYRSYFLKKLAGIESDIIVPEDEKYPAKDLVESGIFDNVFSYPMNNKWISLVKSFFSKNLYYMMKFDIKNKHLANIKEHLSNNKYKAAIFDHSYSYLLYGKLINYLKVEKENIIYWAHNIDYIDFQNLSRDAKNMLKRTFYYITYKKLKNIELAYIKNFKKVVSVANHETKILREINPKADVYWIPPMLPAQKPVKTDKETLLTIENRTKCYKYKILFTGGLNKTSNTLPAIWFAQKVLPIINNRSSACFMIVGKDPSKEIIDLANNNRDVLLFPNVPSLDPFYEISDLVVVPLFNPAGIKLKLIEALRYRKKVVARPEALLGAGLEDIVPSATEPEEFAKKCIDALEGRIDYNNVFQKFDEMYDSEKIIKKLCNIIQENG